MTPQLRFPEFTDEWQVSTLNSLLSHSKAKNKNLEFSKSQVLSVAAEAGVVNQIEYHGRSYAGVSVEPYNIIRKGEIVYTKSPLKAYPYGIIKFNDGKDGIVSTLYAVYHVNKKASGKFLDYYFMPPMRVNKYLKPLVNIGAKNDMKVNNDVVLSGILRYPRIEEQQKIAEFMGGVDNKLTSIQTKVSAMHEYKKGVMQALFSGKLRFKDDNGNPYPDWEEKNLGEVFDERTERSGQGKMLSVTIGSGIVPFSSLDRKDNSSADKSNYKCVKSNDIAYNSMRMWQGASGVSKYDGIVSPAYTVITPKENNDSTFWGYRFKTRDSTNTFQRYSQGLTSDTWNLKFNALSKISFMTPSYEEQKKIADFLTALDDKIKLEEAKVAKSKDFKKGLLQRMFV
jgi:type I restriction enzyme S subunit